MLARERIGVERTQFAAAQGFLSGQAGIWTRSPNPIQWFHRVKLRMEGETLEGTGEDGEGSGSCGEGMNLLEHKGQGPGLSTWRPCALLSEGAMLVLETLGNY